MFRTLVTLTRGRIGAYAAILALIATMNPATARTIFPIKGGSGDAGFQDRCPANQFMVGLAGRAGAFTDQIAVVCAPIMPDGTHGAPYHGPLRGGTGGAALEFSCNGDAFVSGLAFYHYNEHAKVFNLQLSCRSAGGAASIVNFGPPGGVSFMNDSTSESQQCAGDELASGLAGRYGVNVNALGLFCDARTTASAPAPVSAHSAYPIKTTGKVTQATAGGALACPQGFVWREASPADHVCVTPMQRRLTRQENVAGAAFVSQTDRTYGPNTCDQGYVWRQAFDGDTVCVTPRQRDAAAEQNSAAPAQIPATSP